MKRIFGVFLCAVLFTTSLWAQDDGEDSRFVPSFSLENETKLSTVKLGEKKDEKGNVVPGETGIENESTARFAVGIKLGETFMLAPYIIDKVGIVGGMATGQDFAFDANNFGLGLIMTYAPMDMLEINASLGYLNRYKMEGVEIFPPSTNAFFNHNGVAFTVGLALNVESIFLEAGLNNSLEWLQGKTRYGEKDKEYATRDELTNTFTVEMKMDFFNFIKEGLNSGLVLSNEMKLTKTKSRSAEFTEKWQWIGDKVIENEFAIGLHFAPVEFMDFTFLVKDAFDKTVVWVPTPSDAKYSDDYVSSNKVLLGLGLEFKKDMFKFGIEYNPQLSGSGTTKTGDTTKTTKAKDMEHEVKLTVGVEL